ncbi:MAG: GntR family transcriptional regulator, transcriptional repressor for pyruvate dehydrogenase complex [Clostridia bacterium]|nr:GntR family transcriptional regulator, transcriptional repressor for pyruvate dehydrogenase complex [Clostridia bacterium]MDN5322216.1 GntR family transcriptional regulator, transcriptional repressor for pyruvate dehydrogenase complex [Clostridia bacterium]
MGYLLTRRQRKKFHVLEIIQNSKIPVGASHVRNELAKLGIEISEATAGRLLIELDEEGLTRRDGYKGRVLTKFGFRELKHLEMQHDRMEYGEEFFKILDGKTEKELIDVLIARRAIEREMARLAAQNLTPEIEQEMKEIIELQQQDAEKYNTSQYDILFHKLIARAADNKVLETMLLMIRQDVQLASALEFIRKQVNSSIVVDHKKIMEAIISRKPDAAEEAMTDHIENLIRDVNNFWMNKHKL